MNGNDYLDLSDEQLAARDAALQQQWSCDQVTPMNLGLHFVRLANTAYRAGRRVCIDLLSKWSHSSPPHTVVQAWALHSLIHTGFWGTAEQVFHEACEDLNGRKALALLLQADFMPPEGPYLWEIDIPADDLTKCRQCLANDLPWLTFDQKVKVVKTAFSRYFQARRQQSSGGWD
jgi:hypothetical protein